MLEKEAILFELEEERKFAVSLGQSTMALGIAQSSSVIEDMKERSDIATLVNNVEEWSREKGLDQADSSKQMLKVVEELGEVAAALARGKEEEFRDGVGDVVVTLIILAQQNDMTLEECLKVAYSEIAERKGKMINGVFVKNSDLEEVNIFTSI